MKSYLYIATICSMLCLASCKKILDPVVDRTFSISQKTGEFFQYVIKQGDHYCNSNPFLQTEYSEMNFIVRFDSTAIYETSNPDNQEDINKLYGFADNNSQHQQFSARFGWNWARGALRLYAYTYNNGQRSTEEITSIIIGNSYACSIRVSGDAYIFSVNGHMLDMRRFSTTENATGYKLYPYFGGDETAPHDINIWIEEL